MPHTLADIDRLLLHEGFWLDEQGKWQRPPEWAKGIRLNLNDEWEPMPDWMLKEVGVVRGGDGASAPDPRPGVSKGERIIERARKYLGKMNPSVSGSRGHDSAWLASQALTRGFNLSQADSWPLLLEFNERCVPVWSEKELRHKVEDAEKNSRLPWGYIINRTSSNGYENGHTNGQANGYTNGQRKPHVEDLEGVAHFVAPENPEEFPIHCFPAPLADFAQQVGHALSCPVDYPAVAMLAVAASAIGTSRALAVTRKWMECPRLYMAIVADPGDAKSPALEIVSEPLRRRQNEIARVWNDNFKRYRADVAEYEKLRRQVVNGKADKSILMAMPSRPPFLHLYTTDPTTEALASMLKDSPKGFMLYQDEITAWIMGMNQYKGGKGNDRQFWLSVWSGQSCKVDRKNNQDNGPLIIPHPFLTIIGAVQPDMVSELCDERARQDGFIHRILFSNPSRGPWCEEIGRAPSRESESAWSDVVSALLAKDMVFSQENEMVPMVLKPTDAGRQVVNEWYKSHAQERNSPDFPAELSGPWSKMRSYFFRLAVVLHMMRNVCDDVAEQEVDEITFVRAAAVTEYFKSHARRVYGLLRMAGDDKKVESVIRWIAEKKDNPGTCTPKELLRRRYAKGGGEATGLLWMLVDRGHGSIITDKAPNGKDRTNFVLESKVTDD